MTIILVYIHLFPFSSSYFLTFHLIRCICARFTSPHSSIERTRSPFFSSLSLFSLVYYYCYCLLHFEK